MKDYYEILGVTRESTEQEIRQQYRTLAMKYHPDRNPDSEAAEERFKEVAEAYGVLTDPEKRKAYDAWRMTGGAFKGDGSGFHYSQEQILKDLFNDPRFQQMFHGLLREFQRSGFRSNNQFVRKSFFGGKGGMLFGGLFFLGSLAGPALLKTAKKGLPAGGGVLKRVGKSVVSKLLSGSSTTGDEGIEKGSFAPADIVYATPISPEELTSGKRIQVVAGDGDNQTMLRVTIPAGSRFGQKLRLRGKGREIDGQRGDLYLELIEEER
ncbi:MAG: J domain-containing protein [Desulfobulbaceae bacterium]|nr:MAG: J domain-containing protein [Desulfobulbaceae bacterium]